jgi:hypothetical protein
MMPGTCHHSARLKPQDAEQTGKTRSFCAIKKVKVPFNGPEDMTKIISFLFITLQQAMVGSLVHLWGGLQE